jgi:outer membrane receptor for ferrienterochelin and colicin
MQRVPRYGLVLLLLLSSLSLLAQATTGTLVGTVTSSDGSALPGVSVTIASPALQGNRTAVTSENGGYHFPALPPGPYTVTFELDGMQRNVTRQTVSLAQTSRADATLSVAAMSEDITVTARSVAAVETTELTTNFDVQTIRELPVSRDIRDTVLLAPGVTDGAVNDQITISGAMSFDNLFLVNGVLVNENLRGQPHDLFIEDAIQETTILTGGVSAEYGRFTGGVVSTLTKSGGNDFTGSIRDSLANPSWVSKTDFANQGPRLDELNETYEGTLGGRILRDRRRRNFRSPTSRTSRRAKTAAGKESSPGRSRRSTR